MLSSAVQVFIDHSQLQLVSGRWHRSDCVLACFNKVNMVDNNTAMQKKVAIVPKVTPGQNNVTPALALNPKPQTPRPYRP